MFNKVNVLSTLLVLLPVLGMAAPTFTCPSVAAAKAASLVVASTYNSGYLVKTADKAVKNDKGVAYTLAIANVPGSSSENAIEKAKMILQTTQLHEPSAITKFGHDFCVYYGNPESGTDISIGAVKDGLLPAG